MAGSIMKIVSYGKKRKHIKGLNIKAKKYIYRARGPPRRGPTLAFTPLGSTNTGNKMPFGKTFTCTLPWVQRNVLTTAVLDVAVTRVFNLSSVFDPDFTGIGHQPLQFDQIHRLYGNYLVNHVDIDITVTDPDTDGCWVGFLCRTAANVNASAFGRSISYIGEHKNATLKALNASGDQKTSFKKRIYLHTLNGIKKSEYNALRNTIYGAPVGGSPTRNSFCEIVNVSGTGPSSVTIVAKLDFNVTFFDYRTPLQS